MEDMDDYITVIHEYPQGFPIPLYPQGSDLFFLEIFLDSVSNGLGMAVGSTAADNEVVSKRGKFLHLQDNGITGFGIRSCFPSTEGD